HRITGLHWLHISDEHWHKTAELAFALRRRGVTVTAIDSLLAVVALSYNCSILHKDGDFGAIAKHSSLKIYNLEGKS
ncbi:MAG: hypothetical protein C0415_00625, partial [Thermodesulfovibrio sp.]|nr:hypothetical protein [Thermodesulfovibrio sp.]